jgi:O-succinylbenzoic acid--CoA ligase
MTETASQVATLLPEEFLQGQHHCGRVLPHATIAIDAHPGAVGQIRIRGRSLALGYLLTQPLAGKPFVEFGVQDGVRSFLTDDLGFLDAEGNLHVVGRSSQKIITGGENVFPVEVESAVRATGLVLDVCVVGTPDPVWGQAVTVIYVPVQQRLSIEALQTALQGQLSKFKQPKRWIAVEQLPRNPQGKLDWIGLQQAIDSSTLALSTNHRHP